MYKVDEKDMMFWEDMTREEAREKLAGKNPPGWNTYDGLELKRANDMLDMAHEDGHEMGEWTWAYDNAWCSCIKCKRTMWLRRTTDTDDVGNEIGSIHIIGINGKCKKPED